jgi:hypothetical protein
MVFFGGALLAASVIECLPGGGVKLLNRGSDCCFGVCSGIHPDALLGTLWLLGMLLGGAKIL